MICVGLSVQRVLYLNVFSQIHHSSVLSLGLAYLVSQLLLEMSCFCVLILAGNSLSLFTGELVSLMRGFCHTSMIRLPILIGVQLSHYWISWTFVKVHLFLSFLTIVLFLPPNCHLLCCIWRRTVWISFSFSSFCFYFCLYFVHDFLNK